MTETGTKQQKASRFAGFEREERKPWEDGWYSGVVVAEYETTGNFAALHKTQDVPNQSGDSRNLKLCVTVVNGNDTKSLNFTINYRPEALDPEYMAKLKEKISRKEQLGSPGFRDQMSLAKLHELIRAGFDSLEEEGAPFDVDRLIGRTADFYLSTRTRKNEGSRDDRAVSDEEKKTATDDQRKGWFQKITQIAAVDSKVKR